jgi:NTE family protein
MNQKSSLSYIFLLLFFLSLSAKGVANAIPSDTIKNLVFSGGGTWGIAYCGALEELEARGAVKNVERVAGTSVGAIEAMTLALGYNADEITKIMYDLQVDQFNDNGFPFISGVVRFTHNYGWYRGRTFTKWLEKLIAVKTGNPNLTFMQLHQLARNKPYLELYVTGTNLSRQRMEIFSWETFPDMQIKNAVRISMCVPFYFSAVMMDKKGGVVKRSTDEHPADVMVDGGVVNNFPIDIFDKRKFVLKNDTSDANLYNPYTLGMRVQSDSQIVYDQKKSGLAPYQIHNLKDFVVAFYGFTLENLNRESREPKNLDRTIPISTLQYGQRVRHISIKQKADLRESGKRAVKDYFERKSIVHNRN